MTVYVVTWKQDGSNHTEIIGVYSTREIAESKEKELEVLAAQRWAHVNIVERDIDAER